MELNNINLSPFIVANLYQNSLIQTGEEQPMHGHSKQSGAKGTATPDQKMTGNEVSYLGENKRAILVLVKNPGITHLSDDDLLFLTGILNACKLTVADVAIINLSRNNGMTYQQLSSSFSSKVMLLFDVTPEDIALPMIYPHYQILSFAGNSFLNAPALSQLANDKVEKTKLWASLKRLFNL